MFRQTNWRNRAVALLLAVIAGLGPAVAGHAAETAPPPKEVYTTPVDNLAVGGFDVVSYYTMPEPVMGDPAIFYAWNGAVWLFATDENRALFRSEPEKYAPAYGGHGAWPITVKQFLRGDPHLYTMDEGRLYLHYTQSTMEKWLADKAALRAKADKIWAEELPDMQ
jgi:hypothetical protein